jgi:hypothetical protein
MGRTLPSATQILNHEQAAFGRFRGAFRRSDQLVLDELFTYAHLHVAEAQYASHPLPFEAYLLAMLLEEHKVVMKLREEIEALTPASGNDKPDSSTGSASQSALPGFVDPGNGVDDDPNPGKGEE